MYTEGLSPVHEVDQKLINRDELLRQLKANIANSVNRMKQITDKKRRDVSFNVGEWVLLKLHQFRQQTVFTRVHQKLASRFYGPYQILKKIGHVAYKLQLLEGERIHPVFHVSLLKGYQTNGNNAETPQAELPPFTDQARHPASRRKLSAMEAPSSRGGNMGANKEVTGDVSQFGP